MDLMLMLVMMEVEITSDVCACRYNLYLSLRFFFHALVLNRYCI